MNLLELSNCPILKQLQIEEALLRADQENWCILNTGVDPTVVFGISGKPDHHINPDRYAQNPIPLIRRFSGGGTVLTDHNTLFVTFICNTADTRVSCCPQKILTWTEELYQPLFAPHSFRARENDYVIGEKKCGGNAQYLCKGRWLHHTSFLWSYDQEKMQVLTVPTKQPTYRHNRTHDDFLTPLEHYLPHKSALFEKLKEKLKLRVRSVEEITAILGRPHRKATQIIKKPPIRVENSPINSC